MDLCVVRTHIFRDRSSPCVSWLCFIECPTAGRYTNGAHVYGCVCVTAVYVYAWRKHVREEPISLRMHYTYIRVCLYACDAITELVMADVDWAAQTHRTQLKTADWNVKDQKSSFVVCCIRLSDLIICVRVVCAYEFCIDSAHIPIEERREWAKEKKAMKIYGHMNSLLLLFCIDCIFRSVAWWACYTQSTVGIC